MFSAGRALPISCSLSLALALALAGADAAAAEPTGPLDRFEPAPAGGGFISVPDAAVVGARRFGVSVALSYARSPSVGAPSSASDVATTSVDYQLALHTLFSLEIAQRFKVDIDLPGTIAQRVSTSASDVTGGDDRSTAALNDIRIGAQLQVLRQQGAIPAASLGLSLWTPSGHADHLTGGGALRYAPTLIVGAEHGPFAWSAALGRRSRGSTSATGDGPGGEILFSAAGSARVGPIRVGPEIFGSTSADLRSAAFSAATTSLELLLGARASLGSSVTLSAAGGPGFLSGFGAPAYRFIAGFTFTGDISSASDEARDGGALDGSPTEGSARPGAGGEARDGAVGSSAQGSRGGAAIAPKAPDQDGDGVPDAADACPKIIGDPAAKRPGCPADRDADGIADADDRCPDEPGTAALDPARYGCPGDADGDGIIDPKDACPTERGRATSDAATNGCPAEVRLVGEQIVFTQQVRFNPGGADIQPSSAPLLGQMAQIIKDHPELSRIAVEGHTDREGPERRNIELSQRRALSVATWLIANGVDARRLETRGFGPRRPIADNATEEGRAQNRRVELQILRRSADGEAAWGALDAPKTPTPSAKPAPAPPSAPVAPR